MLPGVIEIRGKVVNQDQLIHGLTNHRRTFIILGTLGLYYRDSFVSLQDDYLKQKLLGRPKF